MNDTDNPYAARGAESEASPQGETRCPLCGLSIGRPRFMIPFGYCPGCGNYLKVKNLGCNMFIRIAVWLGIVFFGHVLEAVGLVPPEDYPLFAILFSYLMACAVYDRAVGTLVPAVWWGLIALDDDERLPPRQKG